MIVRGGRKDVTTTTVTDAATPQWPGFDDPFWRHFCGDQFGHVSSALAITANIGPNSLQKRPNSLGENCLFAAFRGTCCPVVAGRESGSSIQKRLPLPGFETTPAFPAHLLSHLAGDGHTDSRVVMTPGASRRAIPPCAQSNPSPCLPLPPSATPVICGTGLPLLPQEKGRPPQEPYGSAPEQSHLGVVAAGTGTRCETTWTSPKPRRSTCSSPRSALIVLEPGRVNHRRAMAL